MTNQKPEDSHAHFTNRACRYFPCHQTGHPDSFNCLFCYCPLYMLGDACGGNFAYTQSGVKDCSGCLLPHSESGYDHVTGSFSKIVEAMRKK